MKVGIALVICGFMLTLYGIVGLEDTMSCILGAPHFRSWDDSTQLIWTAIGFIVFGYALGLAGIVRMIVSRR